MKTRLLLEPVLRECPSWCDTANDTTDCSRKVLSLLHWAWLCPTLFWISVGTLWLKMWCDSFFFLFSFFNFDVMKFYQVASGKFSSASYAPSLNQVKKMCCIYNFYYLIQILIPYQFIDAPFFFFFCMCSFWCHMHKSPLDCSLPKHYV